MRGGPVGVLAGGGGFVWVYHPRKRFGFKEDGEKERGGDGGLVAGALERVPWRGGSVALRSHGEECVVSKGDYLWWKTEELSVFCC